MRSRQARATASHVVRPLPIAAVISNALSSFKDASGIVAALALIAYLSVKYYYVLVERAVSVVNPYLPARTGKELFALGRSRPCELLCGSFGIGNQTHLTAELFRLEARFKMLHVPYKGEMPAITELVSGHVALMFSPSAGVTPHVREGRLRLLAACGENGRACAYLFHSQ
jgi:tripartite-type tricarboxylate transporter receptor subunit TctC